MSKIIILGNVTVNVYVNSAEEAGEIGKLNLEELLNGSKEPRVQSFDINGEGDLPDDVPEEIRQIVKSLTGSCDCDGCKLKKRITDMGQIEAERISDGEKMVFDNLFEALDGIGVINRCMDIDDIRDIAASHLASIDEIGVAEVSGHNLRPFTPITH